MTTETNVAYSQNVYFPESLLDGWLSVSAVLLTTSLLFYHMSRVKSLKVRPYLAKVVSVGLILISTAYMIYALIPYTKRMDFNIAECEKINDCGADQTQELKLLKWSYLTLGGFTVLFQAIIVYLVTTTI
jgi:hypothetical protein